MSTLNSFSDIPKTARVWRICQIVTNDCGDKLAILFLRFSDVSLVSQSGLFCAIRLLL